ncbi:MAG TPA: hypothetical protein VKA54_21890 [Gemmatimonadaceae bacterium]|nr:hypothetical protein [Gemmatimonadaceae bacterium]
MLLVLAALAMFRRLRGAALRSIHLAATLEEASERGRMPCYRPRMARRDLLAGLMVAALARSSAMARAVPSRPV